MQSILQQVLFNEEKGREVVIHRIYNYSRIQIYLDLTVVHYALIIDPYLLKISSKSDTTKCI